MSRDKEIIKLFRKSIRCGNGKAYLLLKKYPEIDFTNEIIKAANINYAYDGQSEGSRTEYILQFIKALKPKSVAKIKKSLLNSLFSEHDDTWDLNQLFGILSFFGAKDKKIKKAIYTRFKQTPILSSVWLGEDAIIKMDGKKGVIFLAEFYGKCLVKDPENWFNDYLINNFDKENPKQNIKDALAEAALSNRYIDTYLNNIKDTRKRWNTNLKNRKAWTYQRILEHITNDTLTIPPFFIIRRLTQQELKKIALLLSEDPSKKTIQKLLLVFTLVKYPGNKLDIKKFLSKEYSKSIRENAYEAMQFFKDKELRLYAIKKLQTTKQPGKHLKTFISNYKSGDYKIISKIVKKFNNEHTIENIAISLCDVYTKNRTTECKKPLVALYNKMNCAIHRNSILNILQKNSVLPKHILKEMQYDSEEDTRKLYYSIVNKSLD